MSDENRSSEVESTYAWTRLWASVLIGTIGTVGMYSMSVALRPVQIEFGISRSNASVPYALAMTGFAIGSVVMGRLSDRFGVMIPVFISAVSLGIGYLAAGLATNLWVFNVVHAVLIGFLGTSGAFAPLVADITHWFTRRRGIAVAICSSGNFLAGAIWPPILQHFFDVVGWRDTFVGLGIFCVVTIPSLALVLRRRPSILVTAKTDGSDLQEFARPLGMSPMALQVLLCLAGVACCIAMAAPLVHIVAYCSDLGYSPYRGAEMLSLMLGLGVLSRVAFGWISDRIGGLLTLALGSTLQAAAMTLFSLSEGLGALYAASVLFGLFFGGVVPAYAIMVREFYPPSQAGVRVSLTLGATFLGMALGGWMPGVIFDLTGSYPIAFANGVLWNLLNLVIVCFLVSRRFGDDIALRMRNDTQGSERA